MKVIPIEEARAIMHAQLRRLELLLADMRDSLARWEVEPPPPAPRTWPCPGCGLLTFQMPLCPACSGSR